MGTNGRPLATIIMGSRSDWSTMERCSKTLDELGVGHEVRILSAHRTPDALAEYVGGLEARGVGVVIAGAGGAAALPGAISALTVLPVLGVPIQAWALDGLDSLLSMAQMPGGIPVGTLSIGKAGAVNAAVLAASILGGSHPELRQAVRAYRDSRAAQILAEGDPRDA
jgi:5-(carboxyamino)imidazole ribonucleotide mutase